ncbi:phiRV1 phage-like protein [Mycobacterium tuberculosis]|uniref:hypothetical protein n=1 Tax=Mycobacterium tuberculosis TaxID=1773 RepID=UPI0005E27117|nr:hypothetical protein [Mycobacterium tuberculosis]CFA15716.1 phiRV1 phage-like protein [Mycobacterium tuberculosis]
MILPLALPLLGFRPLQLRDPAASGAICFSEIASGPWAGSYLGETNGAAGRRIAELERPKAKQRQREGQDHGRQARYSGLGPMGYKPESERHSTKTDTAIGAALGISAGTYRRLKRIDNATHSDDKEIRLFAEKQMAPLAAGSPSWNARKPRSANARVVASVHRSPMPALVPWNQSRLSATLTRR